ncbi:MAG TPA: hypothetical protein VGK61_10365 [Planctomycetota bacterium]|jgi:hypothetical protein
MRVLLAAVAVAIFVQDPPAEPPREPVFKPLCEVVKHLDRSIDAFFAGKPLAEAFKPWEPGEKGEERVTALREELKKKGVTGARAFATELDLEFISEGKLVYVVQALVHVTPTETALLGLKGRKVETPPAGVPLGKCVKDSVAFGEAAATLLKLLKANKPDELPFADGDKVAPRAPTKFQEPVVHGLATSRSAAGKVCQTLAELKYDEVRVQLDEQYFTSLGADGAVKDGFIDAKLSMKETGEVQIRLARYETH